MNLAGLIPRLLLLLGLTFNPLPCLAITAEVEPPQDLHLIEPKPTTILVREIAADPAAATSVSDDPTTRSSVNASVECRQDNRGNVEKVA